MLLSGGINPEFPDLLFGKIQLDYGTMSGMHVLNLTEAPHCPGCHGSSFFHTIANYSLHLNDRVLGFVTSFIFFLRPPIVFEGVNLPKSCFSGPVELVLISKETGFGATSAYCCY